MFDIIHFIFFRFLFIFFVFLIIFVFKNLRAETLCDAPEKFQMNIQDPATPVLEGMISFHNFLVVVEIFIGIFVLWMLLIVIFRFNNHSNSSSKIFTHSSVLEIFWTVIPALVLGVLAIPSFALLYSLDEQIEPSLTLKIIGHQWYWTYEYTDYNSLLYVDSTKLPNTLVEFNTTSKDYSSLIFDSYMKSTEDLIKGSFRLLEVDNRAVLPINTHVRLLVTSADVLHSWAIPSFGIKIDACPGRISQGFLYIKREGVYYGQCSEICGVNHGFMPIVVVGVSKYEFDAWILSKLDVNINVIIDSILEHTKNNSLNEDKHITPTDYNEETNDSTICSKSPKIFNGNEN